MSVKMISTILEYSPRRSNNLLCEMVLANVSNDEGVCWPSTEYIAQKLRTEERAAQDQLSALERAGDIYRAQVRGRGYTNRIVLLIALQPGEARRVLKKWFNMKPGQIGALLKKVQWTAPFLKGERQHQDNDPFTRAMRESARKVQSSARKVQSNVQSSAEKVQSSARKVQSSAKKVRKTAPNTSLYNMKHHDTSVHNNNTHARERSKARPRTKRKTVAVVASENQNPGMWNEFAQRMNANLGIDLNVAQQLAQLPHVDGVYLSDWEAFSEKNIQEHLNSPLDDAGGHTRDCLGAGYYVLRIKNADQSPYLAKYLEGKKREQAHRDDPNWNKGANHD